MVLFGGEVLRGFSLALLIGIVFGTYSSVAIASPIMVWWEQRLEAGQRAATVAAARTTPGVSRSGSQAIPSVAGKQSRRARRG
jgi:preprotein translocase subunit SecF